MTSVERILGYTKVDQEKCNPEKEDLSLNQIHGDIHFRNVSLQYKGSETWALKNVTFSVSTGEKIGIIGRTGAGKSSIFRALTRLVDFKGLITIGDVDIKTLSLQTLRNSISVIPQNPIIFNGTMRENLDPFHEYDDTQIWVALDQVKLGDFARELPEQLSCRLGEGERDLSCGQKQLLSLARALLNRSSIIIRRGYSKCGYEN